MRLTFALLPERTPSFQTLFQTIKQNPPFHLQFKRKQTLRLNKTRKQVLKSAFSLRVKRYIQFRKKAKQKKINFIDKRNIIPNNINHILAFIQRKSKSEKLMEKILNKCKKQQQSYNLKGFYSYQSFVKNKLSVHVNTHALQIATTHLDNQTQVFKREQQLFYNRISRIAIFYYLKNIAPLVTFSSRRLKNTCKQDHLKVQRFLLSLLASLSYEETTTQQVESKHV